MTEDGRAQRSLPISDWRPAPEMNANAIAGGYKEVAALSSARGG